MRPCLGYVITLELISRPLVVPGTIHYGLETRAALLQSTHFRLCNPRYELKISRAVRSYKGCLETPTVVDLTTESASVRASTVDRSPSTMC